ncbi:MAG: FHA domain-containing protein [Acidobacteriaceae bacterium]|nr:FHA domain-containing protein [Acidobacteriaceae bacterium]MBV8570218.1 FHA domain-containing protein [Acidobacteriaceae bacterium]
MAINVIEKLGRAIFESPFGANRLAKDAPELAEIRLAVLDAVKAKSHRVGGRNVFPFDLIVVRLLGVPDDQAPVFASDFLIGYLTGEIKTALTRSHFRFADNLRVEIQTSRNLPARGEAWLSVETRLEHAQAEQAGTTGPARLVVQHGTANQPELSISKPRTNIGRTAEVFHSSGPSRRNDLAFTEENEINRSVSREHAHILYSPKSGTYRLVNDRYYKGDANCGLWIVRDGLSQPVHRTPRGVLLKSGDEIHLGTAVVRFVNGD